MFIADILDICDPVLTFDRIMEEIEIGKYLKERPRTGRPGYNRVNMLKTVLFGFMDKGYASLRELEDRCRVDIRYMYLMDYRRPGYNTFRYFRIVINDNDRKNGTPENAVFSGDWRPRRDSNARRPA